MVAAIVEKRIGRHGEIPQTERRPYIVWTIVSDAPQLQLSGPPCATFCTVQVDCYHETDAGIEGLAQSVRAALDAAGIANRVVVNRVDPDTKLYRVSLDADFIIR